MTRAFGLFIAYSGIILFASSKDENQYVNQSIRLSFSLILLVIMIYDNYNNYLLILLTCT